MGFSTETPFWVRVSLFDTFVGEGVDQVMVRGHLSSWHSPMGEGRLGLRGIGV